MDDGMKENNGNYSKNITCSKSTKSQTIETQTSMFNDSNSANVTSVTTTTPSVVTVPVPIIQIDNTYVYVAVKGSLHDSTCSVFGLDDTEVQALSQRYSQGIKPIVNGFMIPISPIVMINTLAQLSYKVVTSSGEAEICWTLEREV